MIAIIQDEALKAFEQDSRELLMAFFPGEPFCFTENEEALFTLWAEKTGFSIWPGTANAKEKVAGAQQRETGMQPDAHAAKHQAGNQTGLSESLPEPLCEPLSLNGERRHDKSEAKRALYRLLCRLTGRTLPWGTLTGIRPVKLPEQLLAQGKTDAETLAYLQEFYLISREKSELILDIAHREQRVLSRIDCRRGFSLYVGIPFCPTTCMYCSFTSYPIAKWSGQVEHYLACLERELAQLRDVQQAGFLEGKMLQTVYVGGGTPTSLTAEQLEQLLALIEKYMDLSALAEFTVESGRPDSITPEKLDVLRRHGVDRISINPQTMNQKTLDLIGRRHTVKQVIEAFRMAREAGFQNINMDLIMGLPRETVEDVRHTLSEIETLGPDSLTVHALAVKRAARLNTEGNAWSNLPRAGMQEAMEMTALGAEVAAEMGLFPYYLYRQKNMAGNQENTGYALPGKENLYNILMMEELHTVVGLGAGSSTKALVQAGEDGTYRVERFENIKNIAEYLPRIGELLEKKENFFAALRQ